MSLVLIVLAAFATAAVLLGGVLLASFKLTGRKEIQGKESWAEAGHGNPDGYGCSPYDFGADAGCGGGE